MLSIKLCECGCGKPAPIAKGLCTRDKQVKGQPIRFIHGHNNPGGRFTKGHQRTVGKRSFETRKKFSRVRNGGREPIVSPFVPETIVRFMNGRWQSSVYVGKLALGRRSKSGHTTHAKLVWEYFNGPVPDGYYVHHKNGEPSLLENDCIDNLMLLTKQWNLHFMPYLAAGFGIHESEVTKAYLVAEHLLYDERFPEVCRILLAQQEKHQGGFYVG